MRKSVIYIKIQVFRIRILILVLQIKFNLLEASGGCCRPTWVLDLKDTCLKSVMYIKLYVFQDQNFNSNQAHWLPVASRRSNFIFNARIEILILKNIQFDIHDTILAYVLQIQPRLASSSLQWPPGGQILFLMQELKFLP